VNVNVAWTLPGTTKKWTCRLALPVVKTGDAWSVRWTARLGGMR